MLEGKTVNIRLIEPTDLPIVFEWINTITCLDEQVEPIRTQREFEESYNRPGTQWFFIEKKEGTKIGYILHYQARDQTEIGYAIIPSERRKGYCTEAALIMVDYLFLSKPIVRVQADAETANKASQKVLEKAGFTKEGIIRKHFFSSGEWRDSFTYSILREEWKVPQILQISFGQLK